MSSAVRWKERREIRRRERLRRRGGADRPPLPVQRVTRALANARGAVRRGIGAGLRGDRPLVVVLVGAMALAVVVLSGPAQSYLDGRARVDGLHVKTEALETENDRLERRVADLEDPENVELLAREQQGFIRPGEVPYTLVPPEVDRPRITAPRDEVTADDPGPWYQRAWEAVSGWLGGA